MTARLIPLSPVEVKQRIDAGTVVLVDIREADEFARAHIVGATSLPLSGWEAAHLKIDPAQDVVFTCRSGMRTQGACERLAARVEGNAFVLQGGVDGWAKAGLSLRVNPKAPLEIMRQVQIAAGSLVMVGVGLGFAFHPGFFWISAFVGAGLTFAGISGFCGLARLLSLAPWNQTASA